MGTDDHPKMRNGVAPAATGTAGSPKARQLLRRGAVYTLAGVLRAGDVTIAAARGAVRGAKEEAASPSSATKAKPSA